MGIGHYLRDIVYGAIDGVITTIAVVAGVTGASLPALVAVILGLANLVGDGISMGASNYLGLKSELEQRGLPVAEEQPLRHGLATLAAFVLAGGVPLLAFLLPVTPGVSAFAWVLLLATATLASVGAARALFLPRPAWACAGEMLAVGALAVSGAYVVGVLARWVLG